MREQFLEAMSRAVSSVVVVSVSSDQGPLGITVSAMAPVTADPPVLLVCVNQSSQIAKNLSEGMPVTINMLRDRHKELSDVFARRTHSESGNKFDYGDWLISQEGAPVLADALAAFPGRVKSLELVGTHYVVMVEVESVRIGQEGPSLLYANRSYGTAVVAGPAPEDPRMVRPSD